MKWKKLLHNDDSGLAVVEAAMLLPFCILMIISVYYASLFMCQKANMQATLQNALVYSKNASSDTYVTTASEMAYKREAELVKAENGAFDAADTRFPYRFFALPFDQAKFGEFFHSMAGYMFFDTGENITVTTKVQNFVVYKSITAEAKQTLKPAISLAMVGLPDEIEINAYAKVVVTDGDDFVRNVDFAVDLISNTKLGELAATAGEKIGEFYGKIKTVLKVE